MSPVLVVDNGASTIKAGIAQEDSEPKIVSNAVVKQKGGNNRLYIGHEIEQCRDYFGLYYRRPFEKGILNDWDVQKAVWDKLFYADGMDLTTNSMSLVVTEPPFNLPAVAETYDQMVFEEYEFESYLRCPAATFVPHGNLFSASRKTRPECCVIVDSGFSFTHVIPLINGEVVWESVRRIDVGGKLLTNYLKEIVSFRHWDVMEHTYVMNEVKEACCYISNTFAQDIETTRVKPRTNPIVQEYVFPDYVDGRPGHIRRGPDAVTPPRQPSPIVTDQDTPQNKPTDDTPVLFMGNERFTVPEALFHPSDIGLDQRGIAETITASIYSLPEELQGVFWANIGLVGGNFNLPGIEERLNTELRALAPPEFRIGIRKAAHPITQAYHSAATFVRESSERNSKSFESYCVTKEEYEEVGSNACRKKFNRGAKIHSYLGSLDSEHEGNRNEESGVKEADKDKDETSGRAGKSRSRGGATKASSKPTVVTATDLESEEGYEGRPGTRRRPPKGAMRG